MSVDQHRLSAIMFTDMVGYTKKVAEDEAHALSLVEEHNRVISGSVERHGGQVLRYIGDAVMAEFSSAISGVECALEVQKYFKERNQGRAERDRILIRIGLHLGDILIRGGDLFGHGVNVAARLEPLAEPGGICVSRMVYDTVKRTLQLNAVSLGLKDLKNVGEPVEVFKVLLDTGEEARHAEADIVRHDDPRMRTIVVPFWGTSPEENDEGKKMAALIVRSLENELKEADLQVLFDDKAAVKTNDEALAFGESKKADAVIWGEVMSLYGEVEIQPRLTWVKHKVFKAADVAALQTNVSEKGQIALRRAKAEEVAGAALYMAAMHYYALGDWQKASELLRKFLRVAAPPGQNPQADAASAYLQLSHCLIFLRRFEDAMRASQEGVEKFPGDPAMHAQLGQVYLFVDKNEEGLREFEEAARLDPRSAGTRARLAFCYRRLGRLDEAVAVGQQAVSLDLRHAAARRSLGGAYLEAGRMEEAVRELSEAVHLEPENDFYWRDLGLAYMASHVVRAFGGGDSPSSGTPLLLQEAVHAHTEACRLSPMNPYRQLFLSAARVLADSAGRDPEAGHIAPFPVKDGQKSSLQNWPAPIVAFYAGDIGEDELFNLARGEKDEHARRVCENEARFFAGFSRLAAGDRTGALRLFRFAADESTFEDGSLRGILRALEQKKPQSMPSASA